ncbi:MAG TPA: hypothetical protein VN442_26925 [Bryobacteraceae bacterium]|nr:hypothetical protein [Bryobacteraceae bacterium]
MPIPGDAPMDNATLTVWNGERFVAHRTWLAGVVVDSDEPAPDPVTALADARCVVANCGGTRVCLVKDGQRWLMFAGSRKASGRRRDFASPFLAHAIRTAEQRYGAAAGWHTEQRDEGTTTVAANLPPPGGMGSNGDVDLDGL